jgi:hypothetical protein
LEHRKKRRDTDSSRHEDNGSVMFLSIEYETARWRLYLERVTDCNFPVQDSRDKPDVFDRDPVGVVGCVV